MADVPSALRGYAKLFEAALPRFLPQGGDPVSRAMRYGMEAGGKRVRPALAMAFCELFGGRAEQALPCAAAVEMVHGYSLIHDDLPCMDDGDTRRGRPSCHRAFGEATALLAGDALLTEAFACAAGGEAARVLSRAAGIYGMVGGQQLDLAYENKSVTRAQLEDMCRKKTGALLSAACLLGCLAADAGEPQTAAAASYADPLGLLFQLTDDLLDAGEEPGKATWVSLLGLGGARAEARSLAQRAREAIAPYAAPGHFLYDLPGWLLTREH
jgi:geranylgeranyl diphosphate synthase type II